MTAKRKETGAAYLRVGTTIYKRVQWTLTESWQLRPAPPTYYQRYTITYNGLTQRQESKTARIYTVTRKLLDELLNDVSGL